ncbi:MAG: hybrid sensor histidine kinase/response regulator [Rhodobacteraceae bacterium PARR1]|nr:MAG: hybrid sensor histidine kinase/response regulator [Rhodobacteraceae bacterium PARR1]
MYWAQDDTVTAWIRPPEWVDKPEKSRLWRRGPIAVAIIVCIVSIVMLVSDVRNRLFALEAANSDNLQWNVMQTEVEALRLHQAVVSAMQAGGPAQRPEPAALDEVRRWFNVYFSRIAMLQSSDIHGVQLRKPKYQDDVQTIRRILDTSVPLIDGGDATLAAALGRLESDASTLRQASRSMTLKSLAEFSAQSDGERAQISATLLRLAAVTTFLMLMLVTFSVGTARLYRTAALRADALRETGGRLSTIVANSADAIVVTDREGYIQEFNPAAQSIFGLSRETALGLHALEHLFAAPRGNGQRRMLVAALEETAMAGRGSLRIEVDGRRADGSAFPAEVSIAVTQPDDRRLVVAFVRDISDRRRAQAELEEALDLALAGEKTKARFIAVMSHEMRTPLNGLLGSLNLLADGPLTPDQRELLEAMENSGKILLGHVNSVLDISRAEAGAMKVATQSFDLEGLIQEVIANQAGLAAATGTRFSLTPINGPVGMVAGDPQRLRQVLLNLVGNAVKFTRDGLITVETEALPPLDALQGKRAVEIRVIDTGIGIRDDQIDTIFEDFVTLDTRYERVTSGTGLGLGIARRLVEAMGGEIGVESEEGEGSLFWLRLPLPAATQPNIGPDLTLPALTASATDEDEGAQTMAALPPPSTPTLPPCKVLVVEDNEINRFLLRRYLEGSGHHVTEAVDGEEGVAIATERAFDIILMDISMPRMDGVEATRRIRAAGASRKARILALTAHALPEELAQFRAAGTDATLTKPIGGPAHVSRMPAGTTVDAEGGVVDRRALCDLRQQIGAMAAAGLVKRLIMDGDDTLALIRAAPIAGREAAISAQCHQLAGTGGTFGTVRLRECLVSLQHRLDRGDLAGAELDIASLEHLWSETRAILVQDTDRMVAEAV